MSFDKKYQIFISSTYTDLIKSREEVTKVILSMYHIPIGMEMFSADNDDQWVTIQETIDSSDYYLLIIGHRYGSLTKEGISYTKKEFEYAKEIKVPIYAYIRDRNHPTSPDERDKDPTMAAQLDTFIQEVQNNSTVESWQHPSDLGQKVSIALGKAFKRRPRTGWVRADMAASPQTLEEMATLSKENRELKEQVAQLQKINQKHPDLRVLFDGHEKIELSLPEKFVTNKILKRSSYAIPDELPEGAHKFYSKEAVDHFNKWFDENIETVEQYNRVVTNFERSKAYMAKALLGVKNIGTGKANDINVTVIFPDSCIISKETDKKFLFDFPYPKGSPRHPAVIASSAYKRMQKQNSRGYGSDKSYTINTPVLPSRRYSVSIEGQVITFYLADLLQTKSEETDDNLAVIIMAAQTGDFTATVEIICEEYSTPQIYEIPVIISPQ